MAHLPQSERTPLSRNIVWLGVVSFFTAMSSAMIYAVLPIFLVKVLGMSITVLGVMEGSAEAANALMRLISGAGSDWLGRRKPVLIFGYLLSAANKLLFPLAQSVSVVFAARLIDRFGKGIRDAPRDAFVADITPANIRGSGFGLRLALYTAGFVLGPLAASGIMLASGDNFRLVFSLALLPASAGIMTLLIAVTETGGNDKPEQRVRINVNDLLRLPPALWWAISVASLLALARFSQAFLVLKAHDSGIDAALAPLILVFLHAVYSTAAYPFGLLADRVDRRRQLAFGIFTLIAADAVMAYASTVSMISLGAALWGLQLAATEGLLAASIADAAPDRLRGTAFGIYQLALGVGTFVASIAAGALWQLGGPDLTFSASAVIAVGAIAILALRPGATQ